MRGMAAEPTQNAAAAAPQDAVTKPRQRSSVTGSKAASPERRCSQLTAATSNTPSSAHSHLGILAMVPDDVPVPWTPSTKPKTPRPLPVIAHSGIRAVRRPDAGTQTRTAAPPITPRGRLTAKIDGQPQAPTRNPPSSGPATVAAPPT